MPRLALVLGLAAAAATFGCAPADNDDEDAGVGDGGMMGNAGSGGSGGSGGMAGTGGTGGTGGMTGMGGTTGSACFFEDGCDCGLEEPPDCPATVTAGEDFDCDLTFSGSVTNARVTAFDPAMPLVPPVSTGFAVVPAGGEVTVTVESESVVVGVRVIAVEWDQGDRSDFSTCGTTDPGATNYECFAVDGAIVGDIVESPCALTRVTFEEP